MNNELFMNNYLNIQTNKKKMERKAKSQTFFFSKFNIMKK